MALTYFKRYRMEIGLRHLRRDACPELHFRYDLVPWRDELLDLHAETKYRSFCAELDANVFPCLGDRDGCRRLMTEIAGRSNFVPGATWLARYRDEQGQLEHCGTIQGVSDRGEFGAVQNLGITPGHRGQGVGSRLLFEGLMGFREAGLRTAYLEVTAQNDGAVRLYERFGFRIVKTLYKAADVAYA